MEGKTFLRRASRSPQGLDMRRATRLCAFFCALCHELSAVKILLVDDIGSRSCNMSYCVSRSGYRLSLSWRVEALYLLVLTDKRSLETGRCLRQRPDKNKHIYFNCIIKLLMIKDDVSVSYVILKTYFGMKECEDESEMKVLSLLSQCETICDYLHME